MYTHIHSYSDVVLSGVARRFSHLPCPLFVLFGWKPRRPVLTVISCRAISFLLSLMDESHLHSACKNASTFLVFLFFFFASYLVFQH